MPRGRRSIDVELRVRELRLGPFVVLIVRAVPWWLGWSARSRIAQVARRFHDYASRRRA